MTKKHAAIIRSRQRILVPNADLSMALQLLGDMQGSFWNHLRQQNPAAALGRYRGLPGGHPLLWGADHGLSVCANLLARKAEVCP